MLRLLNKRPMKPNNRQLRLIADTPAVSIKLTDASGDPSESYRWTHMAAVRRELRHEFGIQHAGRFELQLAEIARIEAQVRRELYP